MNYQRCYVYILFILLLSCLTTSLLCQEVTMNPAAVKFKTIRDATKIDEYCYQLTSNKEKSGGSLWYPESIDLREDFFMDLNLFFGCEDVLGADGIVFIFSQKKALGGKGGGMGFLKLTPSLGIEFDTYQNLGFGDPIEDHIAVLENGNINHNNQSNEPIAFSKNIENCDYHAVTINWKSEQAVLSVAMDGNLILQYKKDIIQDIFKGEHRVYWGVSAATGSDQNSHKICFNNLEMEPAGIIHQFDRKIEIGLKKGNFVTLDDVAFEGDHLLFDSKTNIELEKLVNFLKSNESKHLDIFSHVHDSDNEQDISMKRATAIKEYLVSKGIKEDRLKSKGLGSQYVRSTRDLRKGLSNTRIEIYLFEPLP